MKFTLATVIAVAAVLAEARDGSHLFPPHFGKDLVCPEVGGTATISPSCPTGPPPSHSHPHSRPTGAAEESHHPHHGHHGHKWHDGTKTVYPAGAPTVTSAHNPPVDCKGCTAVVFVTPTATCSFGPHHSHDHEHSHSHPAPTAVVTASEGATSTKWEKGTPVCKTASATAV